MQRSTFTNARIGQVTNAAGEIFAGTYYPAHSKNGVPIAAHWTGSIAQNDPDWRNTQGDWVKGKRRFYSLTIWNGKNALPGKGMADRAAKNLSVGKHIVCIECRAESYEHRVFEKGVPLNSPSTGQPIMVKGTNFVYTGNLEFGRDSKRQIASEANQWVEGQANFYSRPPLWDQENTADQKAWEIVVKIRQDAEWDGVAPSFGFAKVFVPEGAVLTGFNQPPAQNMPPQQNVATPGMTPTGAAAALPTPNEQAPPVHTGTSVPF